MISSAFCAFALLGLATHVQGQPVTVEFGPSADTFARANAPSATFGGAGGVHVAGANAMTPGGNPLGVAEAWLQFDTAEAVAMFDAAFAPDQWQLESASLRLDEVGRPNNQAFAGGVGSFHIRWVANDDWTEGAGRPNVPGTASTNQIGYQTSRNLLDDQTDEFLCDAQNSGADGYAAYELELSAGFTADIAAGGLVTLQLSPAGDDLGFTFHSRSRGADEQPWLTLTAVATTSEQPPDGGGQDGQPPTDDPDSANGDDGSHQPDDNPPDMTGDDNPPTDGNTDGNTGGEPNGDDSNDEGQQSDDGTTTPPQSTRPCGMGMTAGLGLSLLGTLGLRIGFLGVRDPRAMRRS